MERLMSGLIKKKKKKSYFFRVNNKLKLCLQIKARVI